MLLVGDIGGTNARLAIFSPQDSLREAVIEQQFPCHRYASLEAVIKDFLDQVKLPVTHAVLGVAGPVADGRSWITNLPWIIDEKQISETLGFERTWLLNDLAALAESIPYLTAEDLVSLNNGLPVENGPIAVVAPGTGLGEAYLIHDGTRYASHATEGGHTDYAPTNALELDMLRYMLDHYDHVSYERLCSGLGIPNIYSFVKDTQALDVPDWLEEQLANAEDPTPIIMNAGLEHKCEICQLVVELFVSILAHEISNMALKVWASGGIYLGGGIPPRILNELRKPKFLRMVTAKGRFTEAVENMPIKVILNTRANLIGAAHYAAAHGLV